MTKQSVETKIKESLRGLITVESTNHDRDVIIYIREARNGMPITEASIIISPESLHDLVFPIIQQVEDEIKADENVE